MFAEIIGMKADIEHLKTAFGNAMKVGPVEEIDPVKGYRLKLGDTPDGPWLSPWLPHPETGKTSVPLRKGQIVGVMSPSGDMRQGLVFRGGYSAENSSPNQNMEANVFEDAGVRIEIVDGGLVITAEARVTVNAPSVALGGEGGPQVARVGDLVHVASGSSSGFWPIVTGSSVVTAVD